MATALYVLSTGFGARRDAAKLPMWRDALRPAAVEVFVVEVGEVWVEGADAACVAALSAAVEANAARTFARQVLLAQSRGAWHAVAALEQRCWVDAVILISSTADPRDVHRAASSGAPVVWLHGSLDGTAASGDGGAGLAADYVVGELAKLDTACMAVSVIEGDGHLLESLRDPTKLCDTILGAVAQCAALEAEAEAEEAEEAAEGAGAAAAAGAAEDGDEEGGYSLRDLDAERKVLMLFVRFDEDCDARLSYAEFDAFQRATEEGAGLPIEMWHGICGMLECSPHEGMSLGDLLAIYTDEGLVAQLQTDVHADHRAIFGPTGRPSDVLHAFEQAAYIFHSISSVDAVSIGAVELASILELGAAPGVDVAREVAAEGAGGAMAVEGDAAPALPRADEVAAATLSVQHVAEAQALLEEMCTAVDSEAEGALTKMEFMRTYLDPECSATADIAADFANLFGES